MGTKNTNRWLSGENSTIGRVKFDRQIPIYLTNSLKTLDFTGFLSSFILIFNVFSLVFALMS